MSDVVELIRSDHQRICAWLDALGGAAGEHSRAAPARCAVLWGRLAGLLDVHTEAEQEIFYPAVARLPADTGTDVADAIADHGDLREAVAEASLQPAGSAAWWPLATAARRIASRHIAWEESRLLVAFARTASGDLRDELGRQWTAFTAARLADAAGSAAAGPRR